MPWSSSVRAFSCKWASDGVERVKRFWGSVRLGMGSTMSSAIETELYSEEYNCEGLPVGRVSSMTILGRFGQILGCARIWPELYHLMLKLIFMLQALVNVATASPRNIRLSNSNPRPGKVECLQVFIQISELFHSERMLHQILQSWYAWNDINIIDELGGL